MATQKNALLRFADFIIRMRWLVVVLSVLSVVGMAYGAQFLTFKTNYRVFFSNENPQLNAFEDFQRIYTKSDNIIFVLHDKGGDASSAQTVAAVQYITEQGWQIPFSSRVDSLSNFQHTYAEEDDLIVEDLIENPATDYTADERTAKKQVALDEPLLNKRLIAADGATTGVAVTLNLPDDDITSVPAAVAKARAIMEEAKSRYPNITYALSGTTMMNNAFSEASMSDMATLQPIMYLILLLTLAIFVRSVSGTIATLFVIGFSAVGAMGLAGYLGMGLTPPSAIAPTVILTLAIADSVHILVTMFKEMSHGRTKLDAIRESIRINFQPVMLTSLTTVVGFASLNFSDSPPFRDLGNITAMGVLLAWVYSVTFLPAMMAILPVRVAAAPRSGDKHTFMDNIASFVIGNHRKLLVGMAGLVIVLFALIPQIKLNDQFVEYFDKSITFRTDTDYMTEQLTGIYQLEYSIGSGESGGISNPEYLTTLEAFSTWLEAQPEVMHVYAFTDIMKRLNKNMHGDNPDYYRVPDFRELAAQYLLMYQMSLPYGLDLNDRINVDQSSTRVTATMQNMSTVDIRAFKDRSEAWLVANAPAYMQTEATSPVVMFAYISERNINSMIEGNLVAFLIISISIGVALGSLRMGLISLIPNLVPAGMAFGTWAVLVGEVNMAVATVAAVSLGIIVDDTVHFLSKYHRARTEKGLDPEGAIRYAFHTVGSALLVTTLVLVAGFSILGWSHFQINNTMGILTAMSIAFALVVDFLLLPPLLLILDRKKETEHAAQLKNA